MNLPEYSHIQTYVKWNQNNFSEVINYFSQALSDMNIDNAYFSTELVWELSDNGFMYVGGGANSKEYCINNQLLHIRPYIMGWTPEVIEELNESWLEIDLLLWTEEIELDYRMGQLKDPYKLIIWDLLEGISNRFTETGVYFTNEATDGKPWESLIMNNENELWSFDAAIIPIFLFEKYKDINEENFFYDYIGDKLYIARKLVWNIKPW